MVANAFLNLAPPLRVGGHQHQHQHSPLKPHSPVGSRSSAVVVYDSETEIEIAMPTVDLSTASVNGAKDVKGLEHQQHPTSNGETEHATFNGETEHAAPDGETEHAASDGEADPSYSFLSTTEMLEDSPMPTDNGGYSHTSASKAKISAANKGKTPWNKGKVRSEEVRSRIALGVRANNRERFLQKLVDMGVTEEEYEEKKKEERREKDAEKRSRRTENGGYRPTDETRQKISQILKEKYASGEVKKRTLDPEKVRRGFTHTEETRKKISDSLKKKWAEDPEYRATMAEKTGTANGDSEVRQKISASLKKKWEDPEFRAEMMQKMSTRKGKTGLPHDQSHRDKISAAMKAKWQDEDYRQKALEGIAKRQETLSKTRPAKPKVAPKSPARASKPRVAKPRAAATPAVAVAAAPVDDSPSFIGFAPPVRGEGLQLVQPRTIPREPPKQRGRKKGTKNKPKPAGAKSVKAVAVKRVPKKAAADGDKPASPNLGENDQDEETKSKKKTNGSVERLRDERRDLYDLLYGDDDESPTADNVMANLPMGDDNLDSFDPYGLDDF